MKRIKVKAKIPDLKSCPFCGGRATMVEGEVSHTYFIACVNCRIPSTAFYITQAKAAEVWNTRHGSEIAIAEWVKTHPENKLDGNYYCSACYSGIDIATGEETPLDRGCYHCPNCGSKIKEVK